MNDFELTMVDNIGNIHTLDESKVERDLGVYIFKMILNGKSRSDTPVTKHTI